MSEDARPQQKKESLRMTDLKAKIAAIREALPGVTPGPWFYTMCDDERPMVNTDGDIICHADPNHSADCLPDQMDVKNFHYLAHLDPQTVAEILDRYERMEKALNKAIYLIDAMMTNDPNEPVSDAGHVASDLWGHDFKEIRKALGGNDD